MKFEKRINNTEEEYIKNLEEENERLLSEEIELREIIINKDKLIKALYKEIEELKKNATVSKKNSRKVGRKKADKKWTESFVRFISLYEANRSIDEIMKEMQICKTTYYRYKKLYTETTIISDNQ